MDKMPRKSMLGMGLAVRPVRLRQSPRSPTEFLAPGRSLLGRTPRLGLGSKISPVRLGNITSNELSAFFSSVKKTKDKSPRQPPNSRRCLYKANFSGSERQAASGKKKTPIKSGKSLNSGSKKLLKASGESKIPMVSNSRLVKPSSTLTSASQSLSKPSTSSHKNDGNRRQTVASRKINKEKSSSNVAQKGHIQQVPEKMEDWSKEQMKMLEVFKMEQTKMLEEFKIDQMKMYKEFKMEQMKMLEEFKIDQMEMLEESKMELIRVLNKHNCDVQEIKQMQAECKILLEAGRQCPINNDVENSPPPRMKSAAAYQEMRRSFRCLGTPSYSGKKARTPKPKTPRTSLSTTVRAQLQNLLDE